MQCKNTVRMSNHGCYFGARHQAITGLSKYGRATSNNCSSPSKVGVAFGRYICAYCLNFKYDKRQWLFAMTSLFYLRKANHHRIHLIVSLHTTVRWSRFENKYLFQKREDIRRCDEKLLLQSEAIFEIVKR